MYEVDSQLTGAGIIVLVTYQAEGKPTQTMAEISIPYPAVPDVAWYTEQAKLLEVQLRDFRSCQVGGRQISVITAARQELLLGLAGDDDLSTLLEVALGSPTTTSEQNGLGAQDSTPSLAKAA